MNKIGICQKCGKETVIRQHHFKGYGTDETAPYCYSCDYRAHSKAKKEGRCKLDKKDRKLISVRHAVRRWRKEHIEEDRIKGKEYYQTIHGKEVRKKYEKRKYKTFSFTLIPYITMDTRISFNPHTENITILPRFASSHNHKLYYIKEE